MDLHYLFRNPLEHGLTADAPVVAPATLRASTSAEGMSAGAFQAQAAALRADVGGAARSGWLEAFERRTVGEAERWFFRPDRGVRFEEMERWNRGQRVPYPVQIVVDSPMARETTEVFGRELCRRQSNHPSQEKKHEALYRNRKLAERLGCSDRSDLGWEAEAELEDRVDAQLLEIFPPQSKQGEPVRFAETCSLRFVDRFKTPRDFDLESKGTILVTSGGMCEGGPVLGHLEKRLRHERTTVLLTGYAAEGTRGGQLAGLGLHRENGAELPFEAIQVNGTRVPTNEVRATVRSMREYYSGHADQGALLEFVYRKMGHNQGGTGPVTVFVNHGTEPGRRALKDAIEAYKPSAEERELDSVELPGRNQRWYALDAGMWLEPELPIEERILREQQRMNDVLTRLTEAIEELCGREGSGQEAHDLIPA